jgi:hypothetical protein
MPALYVAHWPDEGNLPGHQAWPAGDGLPVQTCLRRLWISASPVHAGAAAPALYTDAEAYRFLLEFLTGLHSAIPGETNVLGQFRQSWRRWRAASPAAAAELAATVHALLSDAAQIRSRHLQGIGGNSYGSLVRRLVSPARGERILIVGAGELARSIWPFFRRYTTGLWNRRPVRTAAPAWLRPFAPDQGAVAARWADHVILTTPPDAANDSRWQAWLHAGVPATVTHLGHRRCGRFQVPSAREQYFLDQLFELRRSQANVRSLQIEHARAACADRAAATATRDPAVPRRARA